MWKEENRKIKLKRRSKTKKKRKIKIANKEKETRKHWETKERTSEKEDETKGGNEEAKWTFYKGKFWIGGGECEEFKKNGSFKTSQHNFLGNFC